MTRQEKSILTWYIVQAAIVTALFLGALATTAHAETKVDAYTISIKSGYGEHLISNASATWYNEIAYEYKPNSNALELSAGYYATRLRGEDINHAWDTRGNLHALPVFATYKRYFGKLYAGIGLGRVFMFFDEYYDGAAETHDEWAGHITIGADVTKSLSLEVRRMICDLNIESGVTELGISEDLSNLNSWLIMLKYKF